MLLTRVRSQAGFTLVELLAAMGISMITLVMVLAVLDTSVKQSNAVAGRVNATQRARLAMDSVTRQLRSQICINATTPAIVSGTDDTAKFYADLSDGVRPVEQRELVFDPTAMTLTERTWTGVAAPLTGALTWPGVARSRQMLDGVTRPPVPPLPAPQDTAFFHYYAYSTATPPRPTLLLSTPLTVTDRLRVAKIEVGFKTLPPNARPTSAAAVTLQNEIYVRVADPNDQAPTPTCV
jgi:type II secretory pathway pseudopilin PulG